MAKKNLFVARSIGLNPGAAQLSYLYTAMKDSKVFIVQQPLPDKKKNNWTPDIKPASEWGTIHFIFDAGERPYTDPTGSRKQILEKLKDFDVKKDYLLDLRFGDPAASWEVIRVMTALGMEPRMLYWSRGRADDGGMTNERGFYLEYNPPSIFDFLRNNKHNSHEETHKEKAKQTKVNTSGSVFSGSEKA